MSYAVCIDGEWVDYQWLRDGCIDEPHFNWFYSLWTAHNPDIRHLLQEGQFRKFVPSDGEFLTDNRDMTSHFKRFALHNVDDRFWIKMEGKTFLL